MMCADVSAFGSEGFSGKIPAFHVRFGDVLVLGLGVSGRAVAGFCDAAIREGNPAVSSLAIYAGEGNEANRAAAAPYLERGYKVVFDSEDVQGSYTTCVASPGIPRRSAFFKSAEAACERVITEPEMAFELDGRRWICVTGTNGKTTTTALCAHLLNASNIPARAVGNIGDTCLRGVVERGDEEYLVAELSSFQLASAPLITPEVAILLNITPDHVEWHGSHEEYIAAKMRLFENLKTPSIAVVDVTDETARKCAGEMEMRGVRVIGVVSGEEELAFDEAGLRDGRLYVNLLGFPRDCLCAPDELQIKGDHNIRNALAASCAALYVGARPRTVAEGLRTFTPLEHRLEPVGTVRGVSFFNDSKATNVDAASKALSSFGSTPLVVLLGGHDKMTPLEGFASQVARRCKAAVCYGEAGERFAKAVEDAIAEQPDASLPGGAQGVLQGKAGREDAAPGCRVLRALHMKDAFEKACEFASPGDAVCLCPACSSFDEFSSFEQRGRAFKDLVADAGGQ